MIQKRRAHAQYGGDQIHYFSGWLHCRNDRSTVKFDKNYYGVGSFWHSNPATCRKGDLCIIVLYSNSQVTSGRDLASSANPRMTLTIDIYGQERWNWRHHTASCAPQKALNVYQSLKVLWKLPFYASSPLGTGGFYVSKLPRTAWSLWALCNEAITAELMDISKYT